MSTYRLHKHNTGYYGRRSFNTKRKAEAAKAEWLALGGARTAEIEGKRPDRAHKEG